MPIRAVDTAPFRGDLIWREVLGLTDILASNEGEALDLADFPGLWLHRRDVWTRGSASGGVSLPEVACGDTGKEWSGCP